MTSLRSNIEALTRDHDANITVTYDRARSSWILAVSLPPDPSLPSEPATEGTGRRTILRGGRGLGNMVHSVLREIIDDPASCLCSEKHAKKVRPNDPFSPLRCVTCGGRIPTPKPRLDEPD